MINFLTLIYVFTLVLLVWRKKLPNTWKTWITVPVFKVILLTVLFFPMLIGAPGGQARVFTYSTQVVANLNGIVTDVPVKPNQPLKKGDVLFQIDPTPYRLALKTAQAQQAEGQAKVSALQARLDAATASVRAAQATRDNAKQVYQRMAAANRKRRGVYSKQKIDVSRLTLEASEASLDQAVAQEKAAGFAANARIDGKNTLLSRLEAQVAIAAYNLERSVVRAPANGHVTYVALRQGQRVSNLAAAPVMTFVEGSANLVSAQIPQIFYRYIAIGQTVEMTFKTLPGKVLTGTVDGLTNVTALGQGAPGGQIPKATRLKALPLYVRIRFDDGAMAHQLPAGSVGTAAIYTDRMKLTHLIRKVTLRLGTYLNYIIP